MRFLFRLLALVFLSVAVIAAVVDASRSLAASTLVLTSLGKGWADFAPGSLAALQTFVQGRLPGAVYDPAFLFLMSMPAAAVLAILAAVSYAIGAKRERPLGDFTAR
ncbi:MAG: hypothetical protein WCC66_14100 [Rhizobiaceae bacterium]